MIKYISLLLLIVITGSYGFAQSNTTNKEVKVISKYKSVLNDADKIGKLPVLVDTIKSLDKFSYLLNPHPCFTEVDMVSYNAPRIKGEPLNDMDGGYLKLGGGNYSTWMGELAFNNKRSKEYDWGLYLYNKTSNGKVNVEGVGKEDAGYTNTDALLYGKRFYENSILALSLSYNFDRVKYYGLGTRRNLEANDVQEFNDFGINLSYGSNNNSKINYSASLSYNKFNDDLSKWQENLFVGDFIVKSEVLGNVLSGKLKIEHVAQNIWSDYSIFNFNPEYKIETGRFIFDLGVGVSFKTGRDQDIFFYPRTNVKYAIVSDVLSIYAFADGGIKKNTFRKISKENPFALMEMKGVENHSEELPENKISYTEFKLGGGVCGQFARFVSFNLSASYSSVENDVFYTDYKIWSFNGSVTGMGKYFHPLYNDVKVFNVLAELSADINEDFTVSSSVNYYKYSLKDLEYAPHKPEAELRFNIDYNYNSNLKIGADLLYIGERHGNSLNKLDSYLNVGLNAEYKFSDYVYSFVEINNLLDSKYEKWEGYPAYGINLMAGVSFCF